MPDLLQTWGAFSATETPRDMLAPIRFPVLFKTGLRTGDKRELGHFTGPRNLPIPIQIQRVEADGHDGAVVVGRLDEIRQINETEFEGFGWLLNDAEGRMAARMVRSKSLRGQSPRLVDVTFETLDDGTTLFTEFSVGAVTLVPVPAFSNTESELLADIDLGEEVTAAADPTDYWEITAAAELVDLVEAEQIVVPAKCFKHRDSGPQPVRVYEDNSVWGYVAKWGECHVGMTGRCTPAPKSPTNYAHFANKAVLTDEGFVNTGALVLGGSHGPRGMSLRQARDHYAETSLAWADVAIGEDEHGIWVAGMVRPGVTPETVYAARASGVSGHWIMVHGPRDLVAVLSVNTPGYNSARPSFFAVHDEIIDMRGLGAFPAEPTDSQALSTTLHQLTVTGSTQTLQALFSTNGWSGSSASGNSAAWVMTGPTGIASSEEIAAAAEDCGCDGDDLAADPELELAVAQALTKLAQRKMAQRAAKAVR